MSHEWDWSCPRCEAERRWLDGDDEAEQEADEMEAARYGARVPDAS